jgi:hypothetical protein
MSAEFAQACGFKFATLQWSTPVPGLGPDLCHDRRGLALPRPWDCVCVTVALGVSSVMVSGLACGSGTRAPLWPILPSTDTRVVSVVLRVKVLRSTHNFFCSAPTTPKRALVVITQEAEAHSLCSISLSHSLGTVARFLLLCPESSSLLTLCREDSLWPGGRRRARE